LKGRAAIICNGGRAMNDKAINLLALLIMIGLMPLL
jgi:hypothetical protein